MATRPKAKTVLDTSVAQQQKRQQQQPSVLKELQETVQALKVTMDKGLKDLETKLLDNNKDIQQQLAQTTDLLKLELADISLKTKEIQDKFSGIMQSLIIHVQTVQKEMEEIKKDKEKLDIRMGTIESENEALQQQLEKAKQDILVTQLKEMEFALRIRGVKEDLHEDLQEICATFFSDLTGLKMDYWFNSFEVIYRVNSRMAKEKNLPRDIVVYFDRRSTRNKILQISFNKQKLQIAGQAVMVMKEIPPKILQQRKEYAFLTLELRRRGYRYRWDLPVGLVVNYDGERHRLDTLDKAKDFYTMMVKAGYWGSDGGSLKQDGIVPAGASSDPKDTKEPHRKREKQPKEQTQVKEEEEVEEGLKRCAKGGRGEFKQKSFEELQEKLKNNAITCCVICVMFL